MEGGLRRPAPSSGWYGSLDLPIGLCRRPFSEYGIVPYHLLQMQYRLTEAFRERTTPHSAPVRRNVHYPSADAHVPPHHRELQYGQMTNQVGIHAFWENRIPELFADEQYDFFCRQGRIHRRPQCVFLGSRPGKPPAAGQCFDGRTRAQ